MRASMDQRGPDTFCPIFDQSWLEPKSMANPTIRSEPSGLTLQTVTTKAVRRRRWSSPASHLRGGVERSRLLGAFRHRSLRGFGCDEEETTVAQDSYDFYLVPARSVYELADDRPLFRSAASLR